MAKNRTSIGVPLVEAAAKYASDGIMLYEIKRRVQLIQHQSLDLHPFWPSLCVVYGHLFLHIPLIADDAIAEKILHTDNLPKDVRLYGILHPIIGTTSIISVSGAYWKKLRKMFNPAFATTHLQTLLPAMVEEMTVFVDILDRAGHRDDVLEMGPLLAVAAPITVVDLCFLELDHGRHCEVIW